MKKFILAFLIASVIAVTITQAKEDRTSIRQSRLNTCKARAYYLSETKDPVHCATMMTLIYAFESDYGHSVMCKTKNNCYGMKKNGKFITFKTYEEGDDYFAKKFYQWHWKKTIVQFVKNWSTTDQEVYILFVKERYDDVYSYFLSL